MINDLPIRPVAPFVKLVASGVFFLLLVNK